MNDLRRLAVGLIAIGLVVSAVYGTGAFSSLTTQRDATVQVAGDAGGYLALQPADGANGAYASQQGGQLQVSLAGAFDGDASGSGVNPDAITSVREVFTITNQGTQPVGVWVTDESDRVTFESGNGPIEQRELAMTVEPGESRHVDLVVDTREYTGNDASLLKSVTIHADSDVAGAGDGDGEGDQSSDSTTAPETNPNTATDDSMGDPPVTDGPPELSPELKDRIEELYSESERDADESDASDDGLWDSIADTIGIDTDNESDDDRDGTIVGTIGTVVSTGGETLTRHGGPLVKGGTKVISRVAVPIASAHMFFEHGVGTAGGPTTIHGSLTTLATYPTGETDSRLTDPIRLSSGAGGYEAPDGSNRLFGWAQLIQLPGVTEGNSEGTVGEILNSPTEIREDGGYTVVTGENPHGSGEITLWIYDGFVMKGTTEEVELGESEHERTNQRDQRQQNEQREDSDSDQDLPSHSPDLTRLIPDGGEEDQIDKIEAEVEKEDDVTYNNWDKWRQSLEEAADEEDVSEEAVQAYRDDMETVAQRDNIKGYTSLISEVADNPEQFHDTANEADRAVYYTNQGRDVTVEPGSDDNIDLKTVDPNTGKTEYIELKRVTATLEFRKATEYLFDDNGADDKFSSASVDTSDGERVLEFRLPNAPESTAGEVEGEIEDAIFTRKLNKPVITDEVRVYFGNEDEPTITVDTDDISTD